MQQLYNFINTNGPKIVLSINSNHILDSLLFDKLYEFIESNACSHVKKQNNIASNLTTKNILVKSHE